MKKQRIAKVAIASVLNKEFDYSFASELMLKKGMRVLVDFRGKKRMGLVCATMASSRCAQLKPVIRTLDACPLLHEEHFQLAQRLSTMYPYAASEFLFMMLPAALKQAKPITGLVNMPFPEPSQVSSRRLFVKADYFHQRYEFWKDYLREKLKSGSVLVCFPQISYLLWARQHFEKDFSQPLIIMHSQMKPQQLEAAWLQSRQKALILGTRVSLFYYPLDLKLLIVEGENSPYYFQEEKPYHQLVGVAWALADLKNIDFIASDDYPSLATYRRICEKKMELSELASEATPIEIISRERTGKLNIVSPVAVELLRKGLQDNEQIVVLWNKKGFSRVTTCSHCGHLYTCQRCSGFLQLSAMSEEAVCPYCHSRLSVPKICPYCKNGYIQSRGWGIERLNTVLARLFPEVKIDIWPAIEPSRTTQAQIILSTSKILNSLYASQRFYRGLDLDADSLLMRTDYDATFNAYIYLKKLSLLFKKAFHVFTYNRSYYLFDYLNGSWQAFYEKELSLRRKMKLPPYGYLIKISLRSPREKSLLLACQKLYNRLHNSFGEVYGPQKEYPFRLRDQFRYALIVKAKKSNAARAAIKKIKKEVDGIRSSSVRVAVIVY